MPWEELWGSVEGMEQVALSDEARVRHYQGFMRSVVARRWGDRLTARMDALGVSGSELARRTGISTTTVSEIRAGRRLPSELTRLAIALQLDADVEQVFPAPTRQDYRDFVERQPDDDEDGAAA